MIEGPRRPPSAPVGRRIDPYGEFQWRLKRYHRPPSVIIDASLKKFPPFLPSLYFPPSSMSSTSCSFSCSFFRLSSSFASHLCVVSRIFFPAPLFPPSFFPPLLRFHSCVTREGSPLILEAHLEAPVNVCSGDLRGIQSSFNLPLTGSFLQSHLECFLSHKVVPCSADECNLSALERFHFSLCCFLLFVCFLPLQGPRPPSDPHGRYAENKHMSGLGRSFTPFICCLYLTVFIIFILVFACSYILCTLLKLTGALLLKEFPSG